MENEKALQEKAELVVIGNGKPIFISGFREKTGYKGKLYTDPQLNSYKLFEFNRGLSSTFSLKTVKSGFKAFSQGHRQKEVQGDPMQQGGVVLMGTDNEILYLFKSKSAGDHPQLKEIFSALL